MNILKYHLSKLSSDYVKPIGSLGATMLFRYLIDKGYIGKGKKIIEEYA